MLNIILLFHPNIKLYQPQICLNWLLWPRILAWLPLHVGSLGLSRVSLALHIPHCQQSFLSKCRNSRGEHCTAVCSAAVHHAAFHSAMYVPKSPTGTSTLLYSCSCAQRLCLLLLSPSLVHLLYSPLLVYSFVNVVGPPQWPLLLVHFFSYCCLSATCVTTTSLSSWVTITAACIVISKP